MCYSGPGLARPSIGHNNMVSQDSWSLVTVLSILNFICWTFCRRNLLAKPVFKTSGLWWQWSLKRGCTVLSLLLSTFPTFPACPINEVNMQKGARCALILIIITRVTTTTTVNNILFLLNLGGGGDCVEAPSLEKAFLVSSTIEHVLEDTHGLSRQVVTGDRNVGPSAKNG